MPSKRLTRGGSRARRPVTYVGRFALVFTSLMLMGSVCEPDRPDIEVVNETNLIIETFWVRDDGKEFEIGFLGPGSRDGYSQPLLREDPERKIPCTSASMSLVARAKGGKEVDRLDGPICEGDTWFIRDE